MFLWLPRLPDTSGKKFSHRIRDWRKISGYSKRDELRHGKYLSVVRYSINTRFAKLHGRKIAFISDLHWQGGTTGERNMEKELIKYLKALRSDYLIFGGDFITYLANLESAIGLLKKLPKNCLRLAVAGNWERSKSWLSTADWKELYDKAGFRLIVNESYEDDLIYFSGVDDLKAGNPEFAMKPPRHKQSVLLSHSPDSAVHIGRRKTLDKIDLILCGHTHGGQVRLPFLGPIVTSSRYRRKFDYGLFEHLACGAKMIVSSGLGKSATPLRMLCRPEIVLVTFVNAGSEPTSRT